MLDRDGVLNEMVVDPDHGTVNSPLHPDQVRLKPGVSDALAFLTRRGFAVSVCTNQPSAAKGRTTMANLEATHARVLELAGSRGGRIASSHICFHRSEDRCACRKPKPGLLESALARGTFSRGQSWMVGDGITDVQAGAAAGVRTAFLGLVRCDMCNALAAGGVRPDLHLADLPAFVRELARLWRLKIED